MENNFIIGLDDKGKTQSLAINKDGSIRNNSGFNISKGDVPNTSSIDKFGSELIAVGSVKPVDIVGNGNGIYTPPTQNRPHTVSSTSAEDTGILRGTYTSTTFNQTKLIDSNATFITDGVSIGDAIVNDVNQDHSLVISVDSETQLTVNSWHHSVESNVGNVFRIAGAGGTGAIFLHVKRGYLEDGTENTEFVLLNGVNSVILVNEYYRSNKGHIHGTGANKNNVGLIKTVAGTDGTDTLIIPPNKGQTLMAFVHIPQGKTGYVNNIFATMFRSIKVANAMADMQLMSNLWGQDSENIELSFGVGASGGGFNKNYTNPKRFTQGTDVWLRSVETTDDNSKISAGIDITLVSND